MEISTDLLTAYTAIITMAVVPIYIGSKKSIGLVGAESMTSDDAWKFPLVGSAVLFGLYVLFRIFSKEWINFLLTGYFLLLGTLALGGLLRPFLTPFFRKPLTPWKLSFTPFWQNEPFKIEFDMADVVSVFLASFAGVWYVLTKHWISNNLFGLAFSIQGIALLSLGTYKVGCILLGGLFFYDIFWVFGTDVMVTVAKSFDAPIKLLFPKSLFADPLQFSMLGLGDIVIPGIFIALLLRFDLKRSEKSGSPSYLYFLVNMIFYTLGLITTIVVMHTFQAAQPALLYLVPACLGSSFLLAVIRGEVSLLLAYDENEPKKKEQDHD